MAKRRERVSEEATIAFICEHFKQDRTRYISRTAAYKFYADWCHNQGMTAIIPDIYSMLMCHIFNSPYERAYAGHHMWAYFGVVNSKGWIRGEENVTVADYPITNPPSIYSDFEPDWEQPQHVLPFYGPRSACYICQLIPLDQPTR